MPEQRLERTRQAYRPSPDSSVDWYRGEKADTARYGPCPNHCGRMVMESLNSVLLPMTICSRCQKIAEDRQRAWKK